MGMLAKHFAHHFNEGSEPYWVHHNIGAEQGSATPVCRTNLSGEVSMYQWTAELPTVKPGT